MHHTCTCIFKGPLDTSCFKKHFHFILLFMDQFKKHFHFILLFMDHFLSNCEGSFFLFFIQYLLHIHQTVLCKLTYCIHVHVFKKHNTCICITLHSSMLTGNGSHQHSLSEMGNKNLVIKYEREND